MGSRKAFALRIDEQRLWWTSGVTQCQEQLIHLDDIIAFGLQGQSEFPWPREFGSRVIIVKHGLLNPFDTCQGRFDGLPAITGFRRTQRFGDKWFLRLWFVVILVWFLFAFALRRAR